MAIDSTDPLFQLYLVYLRQSDLFRRKVLDSTKSEQNYTMICERALSFANIAANVFQNPPATTTVSKEL
jgi:hypothetical protein